jgi:adenylate cyclase
MPRPSAGIRSLATRALALADDPADDDDLRLRKRLGVAAGYITALAPLLMPILARGHPVAVVTGGSLTVFSALNLVVLARTRAFERYIVALVVAGSVFVAIATWIGGGVTFAAAGLVWGFLVPAFALLALGPRHAGRWFGAFLAVVGAALVLELTFGPPFEPDPYPLQVVEALVNTVGPLSIVFALLVYSDRRRREAERRSEALLTNAIPVAIAQRLKRGEQHIADIYPETTILFADLVGFTPWARGTDPARVASLLDGLFSLFDGLVGSAGMEKIKTVGDAYMAASGAPEPRPDHAGRAMAVAEQMLAATDEWRRAEGLPLDIRIGLSSGTVAGGVLGDQRILFDLWGETVNTAARMQSTAEPGSIQLSESTRTLLGDHPGFIRRQVDVKGLGLMDTYLLARAAD